MGVLGGGGSLDAAAGAGESYVVGDGFEDLYPALFVRALRSAAAVLGDRAAAEDVAAETMARAYVRWSKVARYAPAWVTRVAVNLSLDALRRRPPALEPPGSAQDGLIDRLMLHAVLTKLSRRQRSAIVLHYLLDLDEAETAEVLGVSTGTVHTHIRRGLARIKSDLAGEFPERGKS